MLKWITMLSLAEKMIDWIKLYLKRNSKFQNLCKKVKIDLRNEKFNDHHSMSPSLDISDSSSESFRSGEKVDGSKII